MLGTRRNSALGAASLPRASGTGALCWPSICFVYTGTRTVQYSPRGPRYVNYTEIAVL